MAIDPIDAYVGQRLRQVRRDLGLSLETVAEAIGVTYQQVQKYERASNRVSASQLWRLAIFFHIDVGSLFPNSAHETADREAISRLQRLAPDIRRIIGDLADAIANAEERETEPSDR